MVNVVGEAFDLINAGISVARGNYADAALDASSAIPFAGTAIGAGKLANRLNKLTKSTDIKVIGRLEDTKVAKDWDGHDVLNIPNWTIKKNDQWIQQGVKNKQEFYTASPEKGNLWDAAANRETVYARELRQIKNAGYVKQGDSYIHPSSR